MPIALVTRAMTLAALVLALTASPMSYADPPPQAPAHGWRKKHDPNYVGYTGKKWDRDYGVIDGRCNREAVGAVLGGAVGGAIGSQVVKGEGRAVAIVVGSVLGAVIGAKIGRELEEADRGCIGHALELAADGRPVTWVNPQTGLGYAVTPTRGFKQNGRSCREFTTAVTTKSAKETVTDRACRNSDGTWQIIS